MFHSPDLPPAPPDPHAPPCPFTPLSTDDLRHAAQDQTPWLWQGYVAGGNITLLTSQWKAGKTTLLALLLARLGTGGELAGLPVRPGRAAVLTEESPQQWYRRSERLHFGGHLCWFCRPFRGKPRPADWLALIDQLAGLRAGQGLDLLVIDPLAPFLPGRSENDAGAMLEALLPLQRLTAQGVAVLVAHHPRKGTTLAGQAARGSGALSGHVDVVIEMDWYGRPADGDRRRRLVAYSRFDETPPRRVIELSGDGTAYVSHGDFEEDEFVQGWELLRPLLEDAPGRLSRQALLARWPTGCQAPNEVTLWRWLERAVEQGLVLQGGAGRKNDPYVYWLPGQEEKWRHESRLEELPPLEPLGPVDNPRDVLARWLRAEKRRRGR